MSKELRPLKKIWRNTAKKVFFFSHIFSWQIRHYLKYKEKSAIFNPWSCRKRALTAKKRMAVDLHSSGNDYKTTQHYFEGQSGHNENILHLYKCEKMSRLHKCIQSMDFLILPRNGNRYLCGCVNFYKSLFRRKNYAT